MVSPIQVCLTCRGSSEEASGPKTINVAALSFNPAGIEATLDAPPRSRPRARRSAAEATCAPDFPSALPEGHSGG